MKSHKEFLIIVFLVSIALIVSADSHENYSNRFVINSLPDTESHVEYSDRFTINTTSEEEITITIPNLPEGAVPLTMALISKGSFYMGDDGGLYNVRPSHQVTITQDFYMGKYEVTQAQWQALMGDNPSWHTEQRGYSNDPNRPVEQVSWDDCQVFINALNALGQGTFRLPSEAEWEYACRAGTNTNYYWGDDSSVNIDYECLKDGSYLAPISVGMKLANPWGLHDMLGNVQEWTLDYWQDHYSSTNAIDPIVTTPETEDRRTIRGGNTNMYARDCHSTVRSPKKKDNDSDRLGFRLYRYADISEVSTPIPGATSTPSPTPAPTDTVAPRPTNTLIPTVIPTATRLLPTPAFYIDSTLSNSHTDAERWQFNTSRAFTVTPRRAVWDGECECVSR